MKKINKKRILISQIPNFLTSFRLISIPFLWFFSIFQEKTIFTVLFIISGTTDILDGFLARRLKVQSKLGAKFDTISDDLMTFSAVFWIFFLMPEILMENLLPLSILLTLFVADYIIRFVKHKTIELPFHTILDKSGSLIGFLFLSHALIFGYNQIFLYILVFVGSLMAIEEIVLCLTRKEISEDIKSIFTR